MITLGDGVVGQSRKRVGVGGAVRYIAYYDDVRGRRRSAGTYSTRKAANIAWQSAEAVQRAGHPSSSDASRIRFDAYVNEVWFLNHVLEPSTRESYRYCLNRHIIPWFGPMRMRDILPTHVREWVTKLSAEGVSPAQIRHLKIILSAVFTTALNDFVTVLHPCRGVKTPTVPVKEYRILTPGDVVTLLSALPSATARLMVEVAIGSGLRWGELTELRPRDLHVGSGILTITRVVTEVHPEFHPDGERFLVKPYPKSKRSRRFKLDHELVAQLQRHFAQYAIGPDELMFRFADVRISDAPSLRVVPTGDLGHTSPNPAGRRYRHGTLSAYSAGKCRCEHCRSAFAVYRAGRRAAGFDTPRGSRARDTDGHIPRDWFRTQVWRPACSSAGIDPLPRMHDLRHSHASWLLAGGADLQVVKERLGHMSVATTGKYLHTLPTADETALTALRRVREGG